MPIESAKFGASGNNLRQIPYVKGKLETRVAKGSVMQLPRVRYTVRTMMAAVLVVALLMAWLYDWSARRERCYELEAIGRSLRKSQSIGHADSWFQGRVKM